MFNLKGDKPTSKERLPSFANMINVFMGPTSNVTSPKSSMEMKINAGSMSLSRKKKSQVDIRIRKSSRMSTAGPNGKEVGEGDFRTATTMLKNPHSATFDSKESTNY